MQLAEDFLLIAQTDQTELLLRRERMDVVVLTAESVARFAARADAAGRRVLTEVPMGLYVDADRLRLEQALGNLLDNALRHGQGTVTAHRERRPGTTRDRRRPRVPGRVRRTRLRALQSRRRSAQPRRKRARAGDRRRHRPRTRRHGRSNDRGPRRRRLAPTPRRGRGRGRRPADDSLKRFSVVRSHGTFIP